MKSLILYTRRIQGLFKGLPDGFMVMHITLAVLNKANNRQVFQSVNYPHSTLQNITMQSLLVVLLGSP